MDVFFLRHGEAGKSAPLSVKDRERPLTASGREEMKEIGEAMAEMGLEFDVIAASPLKRAQETAEIVNRALGRKERVEEWGELSPEGSKEALFRKLGKFQGKSSVLCVGHEPYLTTALGEITSREEGKAGFRIVLKKGGLARISVLGFNPRMTGELRWLLTPRQLRKIA